MTERERLIELLLEVDYALDKDGRGARDSAEYIADYLLENGVIVLPCKVGDTVYVIKRCRCGNPANYELKACGRKTTIKTPKVLARVMY